jgi:hypothetical protein
VAFWLLFCGEQILRLFPGCRLQLQQTMVSHAVSAPLSLEAQTTRQGGGGSQISSTTVLDVRTKVGYPEIVRIESSPEISLVSKG